MIIDEMLNSTNNLFIFDSLVITNKKINNPTYDHIMVSISGGSDSDILLDLCHKLDPSKKITYVWFDTGLEYRATKEHLTFLENKYEIEIKVEKAAKPIPTCCRTYGQPFLSKQVSEWIERLQRYHFKWEDKPLQELLLEYPKCKAALRWWCNDWKESAAGRKSRFNINYNKYLKEFMIKNPPTFRISNKCCTWAKKKVAHKYKENNHIDLSITGVRKAEGGARATAYKNCFSSGEDKDKADEYRAIFWYTNDSKKSYEETFGVVHSRCYTEYGLKRTGCAGCPFGQDFEQELDVIQKYESQLYKAVNNIFGDSYEYTRKYRQFIKDTKNAKFL